APPSLETTASSTGTTRSLDEIIDLPLQVRYGARNPQDLLQTMPGVSSYEGYNQGSVVRRWRRRRLSLRNQLPRGWHVVNNVIAPVRGGAKLSLPIPKRLGRFRGV